MEFYILFQGRLCGFTLFTLILILAVFISCYFLKFLYFKGDILLLAYKRDT